MGYEDRRTTRIYLPDVERFLDLPDVERFLDQVTEPTNTLDAADAVLRAVAGGTG
jgi:hypothetical protein